MTRVPLHRSMPAHLAAISALAVPMVLHLSLWWRDPLSGGHLVVSTTFAISIVVKLVLSREPLSVGATDLAWEGTTVMLALLCPASSWYFELRITLHHSLEVFGLAASMLVINFMICSTSKLTTLQHAADISLSEISCTLVCACVAKGPASVSWCCSVRLCPDSTHQFWP